MAPALHRGYAGGQLGEVVSGETRLVPSPEREADALGPGVEEVTGERVTRGERDGVQRSVEAAPSLTEVVGQADEVVGLVTTSGSTLRSSGQVVGGLFAECAVAVQRGERDLGSELLRARRGDERRCCWW